MVTQPALRLHGRGERVRLRRIGRWTRDPLADLAVTCRTTVAIDKALGESVNAARQAGRSCSPSCRSLAGTQPRRSGRGQGWP
jgi:hypothetical protein